MNLVIDRAAPPRRVKPVVWPSLPDRAWRVRLARIWRDAMEAWALVARYGVWPRGFW